MNDDGKHRDHGFMHAFGKPLKMATLDKWITNANEKAGKKMLLGFAKVRLAVAPAGSRPRRKSRSPRTRAVDGAPP
jgi:hypothetical protein